MENSNPLRFRGRFQEASFPYHRGRIYPFRVLEDNLERLNPDAVDEYMRHLNGDAGERLTAMPYDPTLGL